MECGLPGDDCIERRWSCVDELFVPGTTRTAESVAACAEAIASNSCENVREGKLPPCASPGTRRDGEECSSHNQCASQYCDRGPDPCGRCATLGVQGGPCDQHTICTVLSACTDSRCQVVPRPLLPPGSVCTPAEDCKDGYCNYSIDGGASVCVAWAKRGEPCDLFCEPGNTCSGGVCVPLPEDGDECIVDATQSRGLCAEGLRCLDLKCSPPGKVGERCEPQASDSQCQMGKCACSGTDCARYTCHDFRLPSETCGGPNTLCATGTNCLDGVCVSGRVGTPHLDLCGAR